MGTHRTVLDALLPSYHFAERHERAIRADAVAVYEAFKALTLREMPSARLLFAIRSLPARLTGQTGLPSRPDERVLDQLLAGGFATLADEDGQEFVFGVIGQPWRFRGRPTPVTSPEAFVGFDLPGYVKLAMTFTVSARAGGTLATTETRVLATDVAARRRFRRYWTAIRPFSGLIRRSWLRAVARRAELSRPPSATPE